VELAAPVAFASPAAALRVLNEPLAYEALVLGSAPRGSAAAEALASSVATLADLGQSTPAGELPLVREAMGAAGRPAKASTPSVEDAGTTAAAAVEAGGGLLVCGCDGAGLAVAWDAVTAALAPAGEGRLAPLFRSIAVPVPGLGLDGGGGGVGGGVGRGLARAAVAAAAAMRPPLAWEAVEPPALAMPLDAWLRQPEKERWLCVDGPAGGVLEVRKRRPKRQQEAPVKAAGWLNARAAAAAAAGSGNHGGGNKGVKTSSGSALVASLSVGAAVRTRLRLLVADRPGVFEDSPAGAATAADPERTEGEEALAALAVEEALAMERAGRSSAVAVELVVPRKDRKGVQSSVLMAVRPSLDMALALAEVLDAHAMDPAWAAALAMH